MRVLAVCNINSKLLSCLKLAQGWCCRSLCLQRPANALTHRSGLRLWAALPCAVDMVCLLVGEGDFSYALAVAAETGPLNVVASCLQGSNPDVDTDKNMEKLRAMAQVSC